jgi:hypothetical protein
MEQKAETKDRKDKPKLSKEELRAKRAAKYEDKDLKNYELPARTRNIDMPLQGEKPDQPGDIYRFSLKRPTVKARQDVLDKHKIDSKDPSTIQKMDNHQINKDTIRMVVIQAQVIYPDKSTTVLDLKDDKVLDDMDSLVFEVLVFECIKMLAIKERDRYFRDKGDPAIQAPSLHEEMESLSSPEQAPP